MRHFLFTTVLFILVNGTLKAKIKEETIQWITEKLTSYAQVKYVIR
jgi:hypothetical protein